MFGATGGAQVSNMVIKRLQLNTMLFDVITCAACSCCNAAISPLSKELLTQSLNDINFYKRIYLSMH